MASSSPTSPLSPNPIETQVSQDEFFSFHYIDRQLFYRLVFSLRRKPSESMQVIAFWIWLERIFHKSSKFINAILTFHDKIVEAIIEETLLTLRTIECDEYHPTIDTLKIPIIQIIVGRDIVSLKYFHDNRISIILGIGNIIETVCLRAFQDIFKLISIYQTSPPNFYNKSNTNINNNSSIMVGDLNVPLDNINNPNVASSSNTNNFYASDAQDDVIELFGQLRMNENIPTHQEPAIPPGERTVFLTFSKGYPISEKELREFLFRAFGDIIESLYMQDVNENDQPLYAKLVVRVARSMDVMLSGQSKVKFAINGKHVWARKYVRKNPNSNSPPSSPIVEPKN